MSIEYKDWYPKVTSACFNLTDACNLQCRYCFVEQHPHFMTLDVAKKGVEFLINNLHWKQEHGIYKNEKVGVTFFGGEPMLMYEEIIKPLVLWIEEVYPGEVTFDITTNGTLLNKERIDFFKEHNIYPLLSMDGGPDTQNFNRPCQDPNLKSFDLVVKNIPYLLEQFPGITFRATIDSNSVDKTYENYLFASAMGFKNIFMIPDSQHPWSVESLESLNTEFYKIFNFIVEAFRRGVQPIWFGPINDSFTRILDHDIMVRDGRMDEYKTHRREVTRCGLGTMGCSIAYDGTIYGCQEQDSKDSADIFRIGDIFTGIDIEKHKRLLEAYATDNLIQCEDPTLCEKCALRSNCKTFICPSSSWSTYKNLHTNGISYCTWLQIMFEYAIQAMKVLTEENNQLFRDYLINQCSFDRYFKEGY